MHLTGPEVTEIRLSVPEVGKRLLPLPVAAWHATVGTQLTLAEYRALEAGELWIDFDLYLRITDLCGCA